MKKLTKRKGFNFYRSYFDVYNELNDADKLAFIDALLEKQFLGKNPENLSGLKAGGQGFEPRLTVPETAVLPLDEPPPAKEILSFLETLVKSNQ